MKVLLDSCVWGKARQALEEQGHDVVWSGDWERDPGDAEILRIAYAEQRVLVTLDKDFGELAILRGESHCGIVRLVGISARNQGPLCGQILERYGEDIRLGAILTVETGRVRIRRPF